MSSATVIDAALRFVRSNPELLAYAHTAAERTGRTVDDLLLDAVHRVRCAAAQPVETPVPNRVGTRVAKPVTPSLAVLTAQRRRYRSSSVESARRTDTSA